MVQKSSHGPFRTVCLMNATPVRKRSPLDFTQNKVYSFFNNLLRNHHRIDPGCPSFMLGISTYISI